MYAVLPAELLPPLTTGVSWCDAPTPPTTPHPTHCSCVFSALKHLHICSMTSFVIHIKLLTNEAKLHFCIAPLLHRRRRLRSRRGRVRGGPGVRVGREAVSGGGAEVVAGGGDGFSARAGRLRLRRPLQLQVNRAPTVFRLQIGVPEKRWLVQSSPFKHRHQVAHAAVFRTWLRSISQFV